MNAVETHNQVVDQPQALFKPVAEQQTTPPATAGPLPARPTGPTHPARAVRMIATIATPDGSGAATAIPDDGRPRTERRRSIDTASREDREDAFLLFNCMLQASESTSATNSSDDGSDGTSPTPKRRSRSPSHGPVAPVAAEVPAAATDAAAWDKRKLKECGPVSSVRLYSPSKRAKTTVGGFSAFEGGRTLFNKTQAIEHAAEPAGRSGGMLSMRSPLSRAETSPEKMSMAARAAAMSASDKYDEPDAVKPPGMSQDQWSKKVNKMKGNRLAAKRCRERKKQYISYLEKRIAFLEESNAELQSALQPTVRVYRVQAGAHVVTHGQA